jgi:DNA polymerase-3 subunit delta'
LSCRKIDAENHPDVWAVRPESKLRVITIEQIRELLQTIYLKPVQARFKVAVLVGADRLNVHAANAFLKTLEEPPANSILILLSTAPERMLETILSRCLRLNFACTTGQQAAGPAPDRLDRFSETARTSQRSLLGRYRLLAVLMDKLNSLREEITAALTQRSPLERYDDLDPKLRERYEDELAAAIESEYRHRRGDLLSSVQWWLRDIWLEKLQLSQEMWACPSLAQTVREIGARLTAEEALVNLGVMEELQRILQTNVQEALVMEVSLLRLKL